MEGYLFVEVGAVIVVAGLFSVLAYRLRQPLIIAYILTGVLVGPGVFGLVHSPDMFAGLSQIGIAFLLFIVGLNLNWRSVREVGSVAFIGGLSQVVFTSLLGYVISRLLQFDVTTSIFLAVAFSFSSTIIIIKLLSDKEDLDRLYGRIAVGMLIVQDIIAMFLLLVVAALRDGGDLTAALTTSFGKGILVLVVLALLARYVLPPLFKFAARSQELLFLIALSWCFAIASALLTLGFGIEIGALLAGISLAGTGFQHDIEAKIRPLRDFFLIIFFIVLGTQLTFASLSALWLPALIMSLYVLIGNPLIAMIIMRLIGYHPRSAFLTGTTVAQISEFSFILLTGGIAAGLVAEESIALATAVALLTITLSSYMVAYNEQIYERLAFIFERFGLGRHGEGHRAKTADYVLFGYNRMGKRLLPQLQDLPGETVVVDYDPTIIDELAESGVPSMYGDAGSEEVLRYLRVEKAKLIVSTIPDAEVTVDLLDYLRARHSRATVIVTARNASEVGHCYALGATYVVIPSVLGGEALGQYLKLKKTAKSGWQSLARKQQHHII